MLNKKFKNLILITIIMLCVFLIIHNPVSSQAFSVQENLGDLDNYGKVSENSSTEFTKMVGTIITIVQVVGSLISVICLIILGIKYMMGTVQEKAEYKKVLLPYVIGAALLFATTNLLKIIYNLALKI